MTGRPSQAICAIGGGWGILRRREKAVARRAVVRSESVVCLTCQPAAYLQLDCPAPVAAVASRVTMQLNTDDTVDTAIQHHQAGRLAEAEKLYREVLTRDPNNLD